MKFLIILFFIFNQFSYSQSDLSEKFKYNFENFNFEFPTPVLSIYKEINSVPYFSFSDKANISEYIKAAIDSSNSTLDIALYGISNMSLAQSIVNAQKRGVKVRLIMNYGHISGAKITPELQFLIDNNINIKSLRGAGKYGIMHNKIAIIDSRLLLTGSYNWTNVANNANYENVVFTDDNIYINGFKKYFEWMWSYGINLSQPMPDYSSDSFRFIPVDSSLSVNFYNEKFPSYSFSPKGGIKENIIKAINKSRISIKVCVFSFYDKDIFQKLLEAKNRGVKVQVILDKLQATQSEITPLMFNNGIEFKWSYGFNSGVMHNKFAIFDDSLLITGSFNWSISAEEYNFENVFITNNYSYIKGFSSEFSDIYSKAEIPSQEQISNIQPTDFNSRNIDIYE